MARQRHAVAERWVWKPGETFKFWKAYSAESPSLIANSHPEHVGAFDELQKDAEELPFTVKPPTVGPDVMKYYRETYEGQIWT